MLYQHVRSAEGWNLELIWRFTTYAPGGYITDAFERVVDRIDEVEDRLNARIDERFTEVNRRFDSQDARFDSQDAKLDIILRAITGLGNS